MCIYIHTHKSSFIYLLKKDLHQAFHRLRYYLLIHHCNARFVSQQPRRHNTDHGTLTLTLAWFLQPGQVGNHRDRTEMRRSRGKLTLTLTLVLFQQPGKSVGSLVLWTSGTFTLEYIYRARARELTLTLVRFNSSRSRVTVTVTLTL
jgi:hypothetical protein